jgi:hypothetical protein
LLFRQGSKLAEVQLATQNIHQSRGKSNSSRGDAEIYVFYCSFVRNKIKTMIILKKVAAKGRSCLIGIGVS